MASVCKESVMNDEEHGAQGVWERGSSLDLIFRIVMFFNSLPGYVSKQKPIVPLRQKEAQNFCSP